MVAAKRRPRGAAPHRSPSIESLGLSHRWTRPTRAENVGSSSRCVGCDGSAGRSSSLREVGCGVSGAGRCPKPDLRRVQAPRRLGTGRKIAVHHVRRAIESPQDRGQPTYGRCNQRISHVRGRGRAPAPGIGRTIVLYGNAPCPNGHASSIRVAPEEPLTTRYVRMDKIGIGILLEGATDSSDDANAPGGCPIFVG